MLAPMQTLIQSRSSARSYMAVCALSRTLRRGAWHHSTRAGDQAIRRGTSWQEGRVPSHFTRGK